MTRDTALWLAPTVCAFWGAARGDVGWPLVLLALACVLMWRGDDPAEGR